MKTVTLPIEEYEELVQDRKDKQRLMQELEADAKDRGFFVQLMNHVWEKKDGGGLYEGYHYVTEKNTLKIVSKDKVLADAQKEIDRLTEVAQTLACRNETLNEAYDRLKSRGFFARLMNKEV